MSLATNLDQYKYQNTVIVSMGYDSITTSIILTSGHGAILPDPSITGPYNLFWWNASEYLNPTDDPFVEIVKCIAKLGDTLVVMRSQQHTLASPKNIPGKLYNMAPLPNSNLDTLSYYNIPQTHGISVHTGTIGTWTNIDKTTSSIADITTRSHTLLTDIGTNTHATIDTAILNSITHIGASIAHGVTSNIAGISDTQTLTNKTLTSPFISTIYGSSIANDIITIEGTSNATKTSSYVILQPTSGNVGIGKTVPVQKLEVGGNIRLDGDGTNETLYMQGNAVLSKTTSTGRVILQSAGSDVSIRDSSGTDRIFVRNSDGNVGIGTTSPAHLFEVRKDQNSITRASVTNGTTGTAAVASFVATRDGGEGIEFRIFSTGYTTSGLNIANSAGLRTYSAITGGLTLVTGSSTPIIFGISDTEKMRIDGSGNVGIGISSPGTKLDVRGIDTLSTASGTGEVFRLYSTNAAAINVGPTLILGGNTGNTVATYAFGGIRAAKQTAAGNADYRGYLTFYTDNSAGSFNERVRIDGDGNVGIGTTTPQNKLDVYGAAAFGIYAGLTAPSNGLIVSGNVGIGTTSPVSLLTINKSGTFSYPTIGTTTGALHIRPSTFSENDSSALTFGASSYGDNAEAGIYVQYSGGYGTKMYFATTDVFITGSKARLMIDSTGNVGIGTTNPIRKLQVQGDSNGIRLSTESAPTTYYAELLTNWDADQAFVANVHGYTFLRSGADATNTRINAQSGDLRLQVGGTDYVTVLSGGNVGIGTTGPVAKSEIFGTVSNQGISTNLLLSGSNNSGLVWADGTGLPKVASRLNVGKLEFLTNTGTLGSWNWQSRMTVTNDGNVGIGTTAPSETLDIAGNIKVSGTVDGIDISTIPLPTSTSYNNQSFINIVKNGNFESWSNGTTSVPDGFINSSLGGIAREAIIVKKSSYSAKLIAGSNNYPALEYDLNFSKYKNVPLTVGMWVYVPTTNTLNNANVTIWYNGGMFVNSLFGCPKNDTWTYYQQNINTSTYPDWNGAYSTARLHISPRYTATTETDIMYIDGLIIVEGSICPTFSEKPLIDDGKTLYIDSTNNRVGIGTTVPTSALDVNGTAQLRGIIGGTGLTVDAGGNVGIGITSPAQKLDVNGNIALSGAVLSTGKVYSTAFGSGSFVSADTVIDSYTSSDIKLSPGRNVLITSGNVGIGTTNPRAPLFIGSASSTEAQAPATYGGSLVINEYSTTLSAQMGLEFKTRADGSGYGWRISSLANNVDLVFESRSNSASWSERVRILNNGYIGIGIAPGVPLSVLHVATNSTVLPRGITCDQYSTVSGAARFEGRMSKNATIGGQTTVALDDALSAFAGSGSDNTNFVLAGQIVVQCDGTPSANNVPGRISFQTTTNGFGLSEKMRLTNNGYLGIGTTAPDAPLHVKNPSATLTQAIIHDNTGDSTTSGNDSAKLTFQARNISVRNLAEIAAVHKSANGTIGALNFRVRIADILTNVLTLDENGDVSITGRFLSSKKVGSFTRDISIASSNQAITGVGFKPSAILFLCAVSGSPTSSIGFDTVGSTPVFLRSDYLGNEGVFTTESIQLFYAAGTYSGHVNSFDADGFTISWTKTSSPTGTATIAYIAFR